MLSAWRKLTRKQDERTVFPSGIAPVDQSMQKKFAKGVQYNLKIIIKGDRNTGKSTLLRRLSGDVFKEEYIPTHEIQVANINWNYRGASDVVKVEVWDIVDKSTKKRTPSDSLKITNDDEPNNPVSTESDQFSLDAELINVYKGTHGVILTMDITKAWTWQYVQRELKKIPCDIPVLVLGNFRDMGDHRVVQTDEIVAFVEHFDRPTGSAEVYFSESSMKDGFGLKFIYKFLNMPFLILQRETLMKQLKANALEIEEMRELLALNVGSDDQNYNLFHEMLNNKLSPTMSPLQSPEQEKQPQNTTDKDDSADVTNETATDQSVLKQERKQLPVATVQPTILNKHSKHINVDENISENKPNDSDKPVEPPKQGIFRSYKEKLFGCSVVKEKDASPDVAIAPVVDGDEKNIDDFNPGSLDEGFLSTGHSAKSVKPLKQVKQVDSGSDDEGGNPMVAAYEDLSSESDVDDVKRERQFSVEAEFDELSDDERPQLQETNVSIIEQIKKTDKKSEYIEPSAGDYEVFADDVEVEYEDVDKNDDFTNEKIEHKADIEVTTNNLNNTQLHNEDKVTHANNISSDYDDEENSTPYVIAGDIDVEDDIMNGDQPPIDNIDGEDDVDFVKTTDNTKAEIGSEEEVHSNLKNDSVVEPSGVVEPSDGLSFNVDDLEMFMTNQMKKTSVSEVANEVVQSNEQPEDKPKKKKKKKKAVVTQESIDSPVEKPKRKKKASKTADPDATSTKKKSVDPDATSTKKKSVDPDATSVKKKSVDPDGTSTKKKTSSKTKKTKTEESGDSIAEKKTRKKKEEKSELDAFLDS